MKTKQFIIAALVLLTGAQTWAAGAATNEVSTLLQKGLFEEEANHNLEAAIQAYQAVVVQTEKDRQFAATAIFRLGECYRKLGRTNEANVQYQRILREFADQTELAKLSQGYVGKLQNFAGDTSAAAPAPTEQAQRDEQERSEIGRIQAMIKDSPDLINARRGSRAPLFDAVRKNQLKVVAFLLENKADVEAKDNGGMTALCYATLDAQREMIELLLKGGANVNATTSRDQQSPGSDGDGSAPLHFAANNGYKAVAELLLDRGAKPSLKTPNGRTPLHLAAEKGFRAVADLLLARGAEVDARDNNGAAPLNTALSAGNKAIVELLVANKADVNSAAAGGTTPLMSAASNRQLEMAKFLLEHGADVDTQAPMNFRSPDYFKWTALHYGVNANSSDMVKLLLASKADPNLTSSAGVTPLLLAVGRGANELVELLLAGKADPNLANKAGQTPLHEAVPRGKTDIMELLLTHGANPNARDQEGQSPLHWAVKTSAREAVEYLVSHGADVNLKDNHGDTPLDLKTQLSAQPLGLSTVPLRQVSIASSQVWMGGSPNNSTQKADDISDLLRQHGAVGELERSTIRITRKGAIPPTEVFRRDSKSINHFTLLEVIREFYARRGGYAFPDFGAIAIQHGGAAPKPAERINLLDGTNGIDCSKDVKLEFGDIVEIPEREHSLNEQWNGIPKEVLAALDRCLAFKVRVVVKGQPTEIDYASGWYASGFLGLSNLRPILRSSSDLTHVKIKRIDPATRQPVEFLVNTQDNKPNFEDVWLRGGDVIEVPDKQ